MANTKLASTNEVVSAIMADKMSAGELQSLRTDPQGYILAQTNVQVEEGVAFNIVENDGKTIHLALPFYASLQSTDATQINETDMDGVSGGEIIGLIIGVLVGSGVALGVSAGVGGTVAAVGVGAGIGATVGLGVTVGAAVGTQRAKAKGK